MFGMKKRLEDLERKVRVLEFKEKAKGQTYLLENIGDKHYVGFVYDGNVVKHYICEQYVGMFCISGWRKVELKDNYVFVYLVRPFMKENHVDEEKRLDKVYKITPEELVPVDLDLIKKLIK